MQYERTTWFWITDFKGADLSLGIHLCWKGRIDFHILRWMISIGRVPLYRQFRWKDGIWNRGEVFACSNSYHVADQKRKDKMAIRAGVPNMF